MEKHTCTHAHCTDFYTSEFTVQSSLSMSIGLYKSSSMMDTIS